MVTSMDRLVNANFPNLLSLPNEAEVVFRKLPIPPRLYAHSLLVHDVANKLLEEINRTWGSLNINKNLVLFGAATHDIGKTIYTNELSEAGHKHEQAGLQLLLSLGISEEKSKFAASHSSWSANSTLEELLVSLADKIWKGNRVHDLEDLLIERISTETKTECWEVFSLLDSIIDDIAKDADKRLSFQNNLSTTCSTT